jgi:uncharacterized protein (DUF58 family)
MFRFRKRLQRWWLKRLPAAPTLLLSQNRIYLLPTRLGWMLLAVAGAVWLGALNYHVSLAYVLAFWIVALLLVSVLLAFRQLSGLRLAQLPATSAFAGDPLSFTISVQAPTGEARMLWLRLQAEPPLASHPLPLSAGETAAVPLAWLAYRRGRIAMPPLEIASVAPFGLIRAFAWVRFTQYALAYPKPEPDPFTQSQAQPSAHGATVNLRLGEDEFSHLAEYRPGDSLQRVAWRASARRGVLVTKRFAGAEHAGEIRLDWADYPPQYAAEARLARLAWRVIEAERSGQPYRLCLPNQEIGRCPRQQDEALAALALYGEAP